MYYTNIVLTLFFDIHIQNLYHTGNEEILFIFEAIVIYPMDSNKIITELHRNAKVDMAPKSSRSWEFLKKNEFRISSFPPCTIVTMTIEQKSMLLRRVSGVTAFILDMQNMFLVMSRSKIATCPNSFGTTYSTCLSDYYFIRSSILIKYFNI